MWLLVRIFLLTLQCLPTSAYWDIDRRATHCHVNNTTYFFSTGLTHAALDIIILVLPVIEVVKMHLPTGQKIAVIALFGFGTLYVPLGEVVLLQANLYKCLRLYNTGDSRCLQVRR